MEINNLSKEELVRLKQEAENTDKKLHISDVICSCKNNSACTSEEDGNGEWKDYCWKCKCFRN
jgi:hypothetical protein